MLSITDIRRQLEEGRISNGEAYRLTKEIEDEIKVLQKVIKDAVYPLVVESDDMNFHEDGTKFGYRKGYIRVGIDTGYVRQRYGNTKSEDYDPAVFGDPQEIPECITATVVK